LELGFDWDAANIRHIARHGVTAEEVEWVFANDPMIVGTQDYPEEERWLYFGRTNGGRFLTVIYGAEGKDPGSYSLPDDPRQQRMYLTGRC
jgi:uncharacterized DUF497 family protein